MTPVYLLLVTWLAPGVGTSSYQVVFPRLDNCNSARAAIIEDAKRIDSVPDHSLVIVSAVCVDQQK